MRAHLNLLPFYRALLVNRQRQDARKKIISLYKETYLRIIQCIHPSLSIEFRANDAAFSRYIAKNIKNCRVLAYEANPYVYTNYSKNKEISSLPIEYSNIAISDKTGEISFFAQINKEDNTISYKAGIGSLLRKKDDFFTSFNEKEISVKSTTLDTILEKFYSNDKICLWVDVEGALREALNGARESFLKNKIAIVNIEVERRPRWENQWLDIDVITFFARNNFLLLCMDNQTASQYNITFIHTSQITPEIMNIAGEYVEKVSRIPIDAVRRELPTEIRNGIHLKFCENNLSGYQFWPHVGESVDREEFKIFISNCTKEIHYEIYIQDNNSITISLHFEFANTTVKESILNTIKADLHTLSTAFIEKFPTFGCKPEISRHGLEINVPLSLAMLHLYYEILLWMMDHTQYLIEPFCPAQGHGAVSLRNA